MKDGYRTIDIMSEGKKQIGTVEMGDLICRIYQITGYRRKIK